MDATEYTEKSLQIPDSSSQSQPRFTPEKPQQTSGLYKCTRCRTPGFHTQGELAVHQSCHIDCSTVWFQCPEPSCQRKIRAYARMLGHLASHPTYAAKLQGTHSFTSQVHECECDVCGVKFSKRENLLSHIRKVHNKPARVCDICGAKFEAISAQAFSNHVEKCQQVIYVCELCEYSTHSQKRMDDHIKLHEGQGFACGLCGKKFANRKLARAHLRRHAPDKPTFTCDKCSSQEFKTLDALKKHTKRFHDPNVQTLSCPCCPYTTKMEADLTKHMNHKHYMKYSCTECGFKSNKKAAYLEHKHLHTPDNMVVCPHPGCYYRCSTAADLNLHNKQAHKHSSGKYKCPVCTKQFTKRSLFLRHTACHTTAKVYHCSECDASFGSHSSYYRHRNKTGHDGERDGLLSIPHDLNHMQAVAEAMKTCEETSPADVKTSSETTSHTNTGDTLANKPEEHRSDTLQVVAVLPSQDDVNMATGTSATNAPQLYQVEIHDDNISKFLIEPQDQPQDFIVQL